MQPKNTKFCARCGVQLKPTYNKTTRFCSIRCSKIVPIEIRFWKRVIKAGPGDCWPWTGTKEQALLIRELGNRGMNSVQVGAYVGVKRQTAYAIMSRRAWRHLDLCV